MGPGEHNGTFRGQCPSFITATHALRHFWSDDTLEKSTKAKSEKIEATLNSICNETPGVHVRGRGLAIGLGFAEAELADKVAAAAFQRGMLMETAGHKDQVAKLMPALTISDAELEEGMEILTDSVRSVTR